MAINPLDNPEFDMMYQDALYSLYAGAVMPHDRDILAMAPLPTDVVDPFASQDVDPRQIMGFAYNSLVTWIDEAKKANYFSKRFTDLSKLVMKGVMTMGRGLVTLHNRGEDLSQAPMQIGELISVSSYHFRKSYLGVIQTAKSHPEISERLLINQLSWTNLLLRLYKTRDKLASGTRGRGPGISKDSGFRIQGSENSEDGTLSYSECGIRNAELSADSRNVERSGSSGHALPDVAALFEPAALAAPRALTSLDGSKNPSGSRRHALGTSNAECGTLSNSECGMRNSESLHNSECGMRNSELGIVNSEARISKPKGKTSETERTDEVKEGTGYEPETSEARTEKAEESSSEKETVNGQAEEKISEVETQGITETSEAQSNAECGIRNSEGEKTDPERTIRDDPEALSKGECGIVNYEACKAEPEKDAPEAERTEDEEPPGILPEPGPSPGVPDEKSGAEPSSEDRLHACKQSADDPPRNDSGGVDGPFYLEVLRHAFARSADNEDGRVIFTSDEICYLAHDPAFAEIYPDQAADMRRILAQLDG